MIRTPEQNKRLHLLLGKLGISANNKSDLAASFSHQRTECTAELSVSECGQLLNFLQQQVNEKNKIKSDSEQRMKRKILATCHNLGWYVRDTNRLLVLKNDKAQLDYNHIDRYCVQYSVSKTRLNDTHGEDLRKLVLQFDNMLHETIKKAAK